MARFDITEYQRQAQRTSPNDGHSRMDNGILGLIGEAGEIVDLLKKWKYQSVPDTPMPKERFLDELGDVLWYVAELCAGMDKPMKEIAMGDFDEYDDGVLRHIDRRHDLRRIILQISGRASDIQRHADKKQFDYVEADVRKLLTGSAYLAYMCGSTLRDTAIMNIAKLKRRYPAGFDANISMGRYT